MNELNDAFGGPITGSSEIPRRRHRRKASEDVDGTGCLHEVFVEVRRDDETMPMPQASRRKLEILGTIGESKRNLETNSTHADDTVEEKGTETKKQDYTHYTIRTRQNQKQKAWYQRLSICNDFVDLDDDIDDSLFYCCHPAKLLPRYLFWTFHTSFAMLLISSLFFFMLLILIFAAFMYLVGYFQPHCFQPNFGENSSGINDAFTLSWTTFSTVGYGNIYPSLAYQIADDQNIHLCAGISFLCSLESFVGVLYAGFCGAILFGKVLRIQSSARVKFSDPIVVKYGSGALDDDDNDVQEQGSSQDEGLPIPCPVLEFRVINTLSDISGGEILDAQLSAVAILNVDDLHKKSVFKGGRNSKAIQMLWTGKKKDVTNKKGLPLTNADTTLTHSDKRKVKTHGHAHIEDSASGLVSKRVFSKLTIEPPDHPFFRRVWVARHILNETSPLLTGYAKRLIKANKGYWPDVLNTFTAVRENIKFSQIAVSLSGVSNVSASSVYANKLYDFVDVNIGYQFASVLYKDERDIIKVDANLVNDVLEQDGGGGEPL